MFTPSAMIALTSAMLKMESVVFHDCRKPVPMKRQATSAKSRMARLSRLFAGGVVGPRSVSGVVVIPISPS